MAAHLRIFSKILTERDGTIRILAGFESARSRCEAKMKWIGFETTFVHIKANLGQEKLLGLVRGGLRPSTLPLSHGGSPQYWVLRVDGDETFLFLSNRRDRETNPELVWIALYLAVTAWGINSVEFHDGALHIPSVVLLLGHHLRNWPSIKPSLGKCRGIPLGVAYMLNVGCKMRCA